MLKAVMQKPSFTSKVLGFSIVELIVIISALGILVTIGTFAFNGIQTWSQNNTRATEVQQWASTFDLYKTRYGGYPAMPTADGTTYYCLGSFSAYSSKCGQYTLAIGTKNIDATASSSMLTEVAKVGNVPSNTAPAINKQLVGPYLRLTQQTTAGSPNTITVTARFVGFFQGSSCPNNTSLTLFTPASNYVNGLSGIVECGVTRSFSYTN